MRARSTRPYEFLLMSEQTQIPDKLYFRIGEVARLIGVEPYVLRYWETEFPEIAPTKSQAKQRLYKRHDVELIHAIRDLLYNQKFTIQGARKRIKELKKDTSPQHGTEQIPLSLDAENNTSLDPQSFKEIKDIIVEMNEFVKG